MSRKIALAMDYLNPFVRDVADGVASFCAQKGDWRIYSPHGSPSVTLADLETWDGDGVIGLLDGEACEIFAQRGIPAINVFGRHQVLPKNSVVVDNEECGRMAAEYFLAKGFELFAVTNWETVSYDQSLKREGYCDRLAKDGYTCREVSNCQDLIVLLAELRKQSESDIQPLAILAEEDYVARLIIDSCKDGRFRVPEDIAVLGMNNCRFTCELLHPPMSSIELGASRIGFEAARMLDAMIDGRQCGDMPMMLKPENVIERRSTDVLAVRDPNVKRALTFIRDHADRQINVADVVDDVKIGRRTLEKNFRENVHCTIHEEIRRIRVYRARRLLRDSDMPIEEVAIACGYGGRERFNDAFKRDVGMTPTGFRQQYRYVL